MRHRLVAAEEKKKTLHTCCPSLKRRYWSRHRPNNPTGLLLCSQIKLKQLHSAANEKKGSAWVSKVHIGQKSCWWPESETALHPLHFQTEQHTHTYIDLFLPLLHRISLALFLLLPLVLNLTFLLALSLWSGLLERAPVTEAGTGESRSVWLWRTALAQGLISRPSTLPTLSTQAHTHVHTNANTAHSVPTVQL